jgi:hypothetical protein
MAPEGLGLLDSGTLVLTQKIDANTSQTANLGCHFPAVHSGCTIDSLGDEMARFLDRLLHRCSHQFLWPRKSADGRAYQVCIRCGAEYEYDWEHMRRTGPIEISAPVAQRVHLIPQ